MKVSNFLSVSVMALALAVTGCVDDKYDFSDIDTTTQVNVKDLVIPVNIDAIQLKSIIDIDESDPDNHIKIIDNGYAYVQSGDFTTGNVSVPEVTINSVKASAIELHIPLTLPSLDVDLNLPPFDVDVPEAETDYSFHAMNISEDICDLFEVRGDFDVSVYISIEGLEAIASSYDLKDFTLKLPDGMNISDAGEAKYDAKTNTLVLNSTMPNPTLDIKCHVSGMNISAGAFDEATHSLTMDGVVGIVDGGSIKITPRKSVNVSDITGLTLKVEYAFSEMAVKSIDGIIKYDIDDVDVPEINISDLPDVLAQAGTNLILANPCLYLGINNPLSVIGAYAQTGFTITSYHGDASALYAIDDPYFTIAANATDNFCFSPKMPSKPDASFANCTHVSFTKLSYVLSGDGLPDKLKVDLVDPNMPKQRIKDFLLDHDYGNVHGEYKFVAPLEFLDGTHISYSDVVDGWSSEDLDKMTITRLEVNLNISTDVPVSIDFTGYPIDKAGNRINNVSIDGAKVDANANNQQLKIAITGEISGLDGIEFVAKAAAVSSDKPLGPDMTITLSNVRPCVSGYYKTEL